MLPIGCPPARKYRRCPPLAVITVRVSGQPSLSGPPACCCDPAQVQAMLGHASIDTAARYFRSGSAENAAVIERIFDH